MKYLKRFLLVVSISLLIFLIANYLHYILIGFFFLLFIAEYLLLNWIYKKIQKL